MSIPGKSFTAKRIYTDQPRGEGASPEESARLSAEFTIARDEKGRVHYEMAFESVERGKLVIGGFDVQIYDPVAHKWARYFQTADRGLPAEPVAEVRMQERLSKIMNPPPLAPEAKLSEEPASEAALPAGSGPSPGELLADQAALADVPPDVDLPKRSINGVAAVGLRNVIRYGKKGEFFQIQENWFSPEWAVDMRQIVLRETIGEQRVETREIVGGEPDPVLFEIPPGYKVRKER
jgi:hypothetical protein